MLTCCKAGHLIDLNIEIRQIWLKQRLDSIV